MNQLPLPRDIERPLGLEPNRMRRPRRFRAPKLRALATTAGAICILATASAISLRERPFRIPAEIVTTTPKVSAADSPAKESKAAAVPVDSAGSTASPRGPSIIRVNPDSASAAAAKNVIVIRDPSAIGQDLRVAHLPDKALIEPSDTGPLPIRAADGRRPFDVYARPWSGARGARIAIVIGGLGVSQTGTQQALERLPAEVTLAFASQGNSLGRWMAVARHGGHEIVMQVPLEPFDYPNVNPGRNTLTVADDPQTTVRNLDWSLSRITNYTCIMNYMGARFTADPDAMATLMTELARRGVGYVDDGSSARSLASRVALEKGVPFAVADTAIDAVQDRGEILKKLDQLERTARAKGFAIGTGSAFEVTVDTVSAWVNEAKKRGIEIVPVSAVATDPEKS